MSLKKSYLIALAALLPSMSAQAIQVPILTGTWEGKLVCDGVAHGVGKTRSTLNKVTLKITQTSNTISIDRVDDGVAIDASPVDYTGFVIADLKKPTLKGQAAVASCTSNKDIFSGGYSELSNLSVTADLEKAKGSLKGISTYSYPSTNHALEVGTCKWQFKLIDAADPMVAPSCF